MTFTPEELAICRRIASRPLVKKAYPSGDPWGGPAPMTMYWGQPRSQRTSTADSAFGHLFQNTLGQNGLFGNARDFLLGDPATRVPGYLKRRASNVFQGSTLTGDFWKNLKEQDSRLSAGQDMRELARQGAENNPYIQRQAESMNRAVQGTGGWWDSAKNWMGTKALAATGGTTNDAWRSGPDTPITGPTLF